MPSVVMSVTPALLPNSTTQSSLSGPKRVRSPELDGSHSASTNPESPDSAEEGVMATNAQNEVSAKGNLIDEINSVEEKISSFSNSQDDQCSSTHSPVKSESALSPSLTLISSGHHHYPHSDECQESDDRSCNMAGRNLNLITCQDCGLICAGQSHYQVHIRSHTGERPFKCAICGVAFTQKGNLRRHYKIHSDEKPFQCPICSYRCRRRDALNGHMRIHSDVRPYRCVYCARSYKSRQSLKEHEFQCPYKKDPALPDGSPGGHSNSETQRSFSEPGQSPGYRDEDVITSNGAPEQISPTVIRNTGLDSAKYNYLRSVAGNLNTSPAIASIFAQALTSGSLPSGGKRKSTNPQKIPRFKDFAASHPLMQLQPPLLHQSAYGLRENDRTAITSSPLPIPAIHLPFIPPNMLSSVLQQHQLRQAAVSASLQANSQQQALDFSAGRQRDTFRDEASGQPIDLHRSGGDDYPKEVVTYQGKYSSNSAKLSGSAKRKRPKYLNERIVDTEYPDDVSKRSRESSPDTDISKERELGKMASERDEWRNMETMDSPVNFSAKQVPSLLRIKEDTPGEMLRVFKSSSKGDDSSSDVMQGAEELKSYFCKHCRCIFLDEVMYAIHAGCHGFQDPFECNICGFRACDRFQFQSHMTRCEHSETLTGASRRKSPSPSRCLPDDALGVMKKYSVSGNRDLTTNRRMGGSLQNSQE